MIKNNHIKRLAWCLMLVFLLSVLKGKAQDEAKHRLSLGIKFGGNISTLASDYIDLPDSRWGYQAGISGLYRLNSLLAVELDVMYANVGCEVIDPAKIYFPGTPGLSNMTKASVEMQALQLPLVLNIYALDMGAFKTRFILGTEFNYYISASAVNTRQETYGETKSRTDISSAFQNGDWGAVAGIGFDFKNLFHSTTLEVKYRAGITPVNYIRSSAFKDFGMNTISLNLGFSF